MNAQGEKNPYLEPKSGLGTHREQLSPSRMRAPALVASFFLGIAWQLLYTIISGEFVWQLDVLFSLAGGLTGIFSGYYTIWSRIKCSGRESPIHVIANYYLSICFFWLTVVAVIYIKNGFALDGILEVAKILIVFLVYGTIPWGVLLVPLCFICRAAIWQIYRSSPLMKEEAV